MKDFKAIPLELKEVNEYIKLNHRHHKPVYRDKFRCGALYKGEIVGVVQLARPVNRFLDDGKTIEVVRLATNGFHNACSFLYSRAAQAAKALGYEKIITYILEDESGASLKAAGWQLVQKTNGGSWNCISRPRKQGVIKEYDILGERIIYIEAPTCRKKRYMKILI